MYALDQEIGGLCLPCRMGHHVPCNRDGESMPLDGPFGPCALCGYNFTTHPNFGLPAART
jgi:hypothetical protein